MAVLTAGLHNLSRQLTEWSPGRVLPDGWIGDAAHRGRTSGHNPDDTAGSKPAWDGDPDNLAEVRALDIKTVFNNGVSGQRVVDHLIQLPNLGSVIRYLIHDGWFYHSRTGFAREPFVGDNPHETHIHAEGAWTQSGDNNTTFNFRLEDIPVMLTDADKNWLRDTVNAAAALAVQSRIDDIARAVATYPVDIQTDTPGVNMQPWSSVDAYARDERQAVHADVRGVRTVVNSLADDMATVLSRLPEPPA